MAGHYYPNLALAHALRRQGHEVAFYTGPAAQAAIEEEGFKFFPFRRIPARIFEDEILAPYTAATRWGRLLEKRRRYYDWLVGLLPAQVDDLSEILDEWNPDVLVSDPMMWGPLLVHRELRNIPMALFDYLPFCLLPGPEIPPLGLGTAPGRGLAGRLRVKLIAALVSQMTAEIRRGANKVRSKYGLAPLSMPVMQFVADLPLYLVAGAPEMDFNRGDLPPTVHYIGPCLWSKTQLPEAEWLRQIPPGRKVVHITEGTVHSNAPLVLSAAAKGLANLDMDVIMATGTHRRPEEMGLEPLAKNIRVERWVSYDHLLPRTDLVVTTAGAGTVVSALRLGIPLVMVPTDWDKPDVACRTAEAGAGLLLKPEQCTPQALRTAVQTVLTTSAFRENAHRIAESFKRYGGPGQGAELLQTLAVRTAAA